MLESERAVISTRIGAHRKLMREGVKCSDGANVAPWLSSRSVFE